MDPASRQFPDVAVGTDGVDVDFGTGVVYRVEALKVDPASGLPVITRLSISRSEGLTKADLAAPLTRLARLASVLLMGGSTDLMTDLVASTAREGRTWNDDHYREVADLVMRLRAHGSPVRRAIGAHFSVEPPTVDKWIKKAKQLGYLSGDLRTGARKDAR